MNDLIVFNNEKLGLRVRTILNDDGSVSVNAEDVAIGFGWTQEKNGKSYVRWETLNGYCREFGFSQLVGKDDYIPESLFYRLGMKANNAVADKFQNWLAMEVIPSIRKTGKYSSVPVKSVPTLSEATEAAKFIRDVYREAGVDARYIAVSVNGIYKEAGINIPLPIEMKEDKLYDQTQIAVELGIMSQSGKPHSQAVGVIINMLSIPDNDKITTPYTNHGHSGVVVQYTQRVIDMIKAWLKEKSYPNIIKDGTKNYKIIYAEG